MSEKCKQCVYYESDYFLKPCKRCIHSNAISSGIVWFSNFYREKEVPEKTEPHIDKCRPKCEKALKCKYNNGFTCDNRNRKYDEEHCCCEPKEECRGDDNETKTK